MSLKNQNVLISGASIAGPALAYWLGRHGFNPTVIERAPSVRDGGYAVDIRGTAVDVTERMGIMDDVRRASTDMRGMSYVDSSNRSLADLDIERVVGTAAGRDVEIMRGDLSRILYERTKDDAEYLFDDSVTSVEEDDHGVRVTFERSEPRTFHLVVGADGLHSTVRSLAFGDESQFRRYLGYYVSIFSTENHLDLDRWAVLYNVPGKLAGVYSARQNTEAKAVFAFASEELRYNPRDTAQQKAILADAFAGQGWEVPRLLKSMETAPDFYFDSISQIHMDSWSRGRVVLLGDAGYCASPLSGQGTSLALVGAYVLAGELKAAAGDHRTAFQRYEEQTRDYVWQNQKIAPAGARALAPKRRWQLRLRNQLVRLLPHIPGLNSLSGRIQRAANAITLKRYEQETASS